MVSSLADELRQGKVLQQKTERCGHSSAWHCEGTPICSSRFCIAVWQVASCSQSEVAQCLSRKGFTLATQLPLRNSFLALVGFVLISVLSTAKFRFATVAFRYRKRFPAETRAALCFDLIRSRKPFYFDSHSVNFSYKNSSFLSSLFGFFDLIYSIWTYDPISILFRFDLKLGDMWGPT